MILGNKTSLDSTEVEECKQIVENYVKTNDPSAKIVLTDMIKINECFYHFKHLFNDMSKRFDKASSQAGTAKIMKDGLGVKPDTGPDVNSVGQSEEVKRLKLLIQQRDNEIMILLNLINKNKKDGKVFIKF
jgi:kinesin family protein 6/9